MYWIGWVFLPLSRSHSPTHAIRYLWRLKMKEKKLSTGVHMLHYSENPWRNETGSLISQSIYWLMALHALEHRLQKNKEKKHPPCVISFVFFNSTQPRVDFSEQGFSEKNNNQILVFENKILARFVFSVFGSVCGERAICTWGYLEWYIFKWEFGWFFSALKLEFYGMKREDCGTNGTTYKKNIRLIVWYN